MISGFVRVKEFAGVIGIGLRSAAGVARPPLASFPFLGAMDRAVEGAVGSPAGPLGRFLCLGAMAAAPNARAGPSFYALPVGRGYVGCPLAPDAGVKSPGGRRSGLPSREPVG